MLGPERVLVGCWEREPDLGLSTPGRGEEAEVVCRCPWRYGLAPWMRRRCQAPQGRRRPVACQVKPGLKEGKPGEWLPGLRR